MEDYGYLLRQRMTEMGYNPTTLANAVGCSESAMSRYVLGQRVPTLSISQKIAHILNTTIEKLWPLLWD